MWPFSSKEAKSPEKTCRQCHYFNEYKFPDRVLPDKRVVRGEVTRWECSRGDFDLNNLDPCELFLKNPSWQNRIPLLTLRIPRVTSNGRSMTPEPVKDWIQKQTDLSPAERDDLAEDLENYFVQRSKRIEQEKL